MNYSIKKKNEKLIFYPKTVCPKKVKNSQINILTSSFELMKFGVENKILLIKKFRKRSHLDL